MILAQLAPAGASMTDVLLGLGLPGVVMLALGWVVKTLYQRATEDATYHRTRADRLEQQLRDDNATMRTEVVPLLARATETIGDAVTALETMRRERQ